MYNGRMKMFKTCAINTYVTSIEFNIIIFIHSERK